MTDYRNYYSRTLQRRTNRRGYLAVAMLLAALGVVGRLEQEPAPEPAPPIKAAAKSATQEQIERILPPQYARPIAERTAYPRTMAAIAHTETVAVGGNHRTVGDGGKSKGLFQIQPKFWGDVAMDDLEAQIAQADQVFLRLVERYGYREAVRRWNGDGPASRHYQRVVLAKVRELQP